MQTRFAEFMQQRPERDELDAILRACVHCGFCNASCPTYRLTGNELDGPRGRIYLLKQMLEGNPVSSISQYHLDRCLRCQACETSCPSGVRYGRLLDVGREILAQKLNREGLEGFKRYLILNIFPYSRRFSALLYLARKIKPVLPKSLGRKITDIPPVLTWPKLRHPRRMLILPGCVQTALAPQIDVCVANILDKLGISLIRVQQAGCCGALNYHLTDTEQARVLARKNIDACLGYFEQGAEAIVSTASGCGLMLKEYGQLLQFDAQYAEKASRLAARSRDISEILADENLQLFYKKRRQKVVFQSPCTLQHGQRLSAIAENILQQSGYTLLTVDDGHLCCGSAGVYSLLQTRLSESLLNDKLAALSASGADVIASANIGCITHLQAQSNIPVRHWIELI